MALEKTKCKASKKILLPDPSVRSVMVKYQDKLGEITFENIFNQQLGYLLFKEFCQNVPQFKFYEEIKNYEILDTPEDRMKKAKEIYDKFIMIELLINTGLYR